MLESRLLLESGGLRSERIYKTRRSIGLEGLARRVGEWRTGLLHLVALHLWLTKLRLAELRLRLEAGRLWLHRRVLLRHRRHRGHCTVLLLLRVATIASRLLLELLVLLLHLKFLQALTGRSHLSWLEASLHWLLYAGVLWVKRRRREGRLLGVESGCGCCPWRWWHGNTGTHTLLHRRRRSLVASLLGPQSGNLVEDSLISALLLLLRRLRRLCGSDRSGSRCRCCASGSRLKRQGEQG